MAEENKETKQETEETEETEETSESTESSEKETSETEDLDTDDLSESDLAIAKEMYKALRDPKRNKTTVQNLAKNLGLSLGEGTVKTETKAEDTQGKQVKISDLVDENIPESWKPLAPILTKILENYQAQFVDPKFTQTEGNLHNERSTNALDWARDKYKDFDNYAQEMTEISQEMPPGKLTSQRDYNRYAERVYLLAKGSSSGEGNIADILAKTVNKTVKNAKRAKPGPSDVNRTKSDVTAKTPRDAIAMAMKELQSQK